MVRLIRSNGVVGGSRPTETRERRVEIIISAFVKDIIIIIIVVHGSKRFIMLVSAIRTESLVNENFHHRERSPSTGPI